MHRHILNLIFVFPILSIFFLNSTSTPQAHPDLIVIDSNVKYSQHLINGLDSNTIALVLNPERDGVAQITFFLESLPPLNSLHIISHGSPGRLQLGTGQLQAGTLAHYADQLRAWAASLTGEGDILLYGCNVAQGETGAKFVTELGHLTGADIAASINPTGSAILGGDWVLEFAAGSIASDPVFASSTLIGYPAVLSRPVLDIAGNPSLPDVNQGNTNPEGILLADLLGTTITDIDTGSVEGVAITATSGAGTWQYSLDGTTWSNIGAVSDASAVVLNSLFSLYDGPAGGFPTAQGWLTKNTVNGVNESGGTTSTTLDTSANDSTQDGYSNYMPDFQGGANLVNEAFPALSATSGYTLRFEMKLNSEEHVNGQKNTGTDQISDRAGFSILAVSDDPTKSIELGFWSNEVWAQADGPEQPNSGNGFTGTLFTHAEGAPYTTTITTLYDLDIQGSSYALSSNKQAILTGNLRNYAAWTPPSGQAPDPYEISNYLFLGDNTTSANGSFTLSRIEILNKTRLRFVPNAGFSGPATISYRAWDTTDGSRSGDHGVDATGGSFSTNTEIATVTVNPNGATWFIYLPLLQKS